MTDKSARTQDGDEVNPKIDPALNSNTEKEPDDWVSGGDPMTGAGLPTMRASARLLFAIAFIGGMDNAALAGSRASLARPFGSRL